MAAFDSAAFLTTAFDPAAFDFGSLGGTRSRTGRSRARGALWAVLFLALWVA